jgi:hypothetical protein
MASLQVTKQQSIITERKTLVIQRVNKTLAVGKVRTDSGVGG